MTTRNLKYGVLTTYNKTYMIKRIGTVVSISESISYDSLNPSLVTCLSYLLSLNDNDNDQPINDQLSIHISSTRTYNEVNSTDNESTPFIERCPRDVATTPTSGSPQRRSLRTHQNQSSIPNSMFSVLDFAGLLGEGRCRVFKERCYNMAVKCVDPGKQKDLVPEIDHELEIYKILEDLQGRDIPSVVWTGRCYGGVFYGFGLSPIGVIPELSKLTLAQKSSIVASLDRIHNKGIMHNDIKLSNMIIDDSGNIYFIDFGFATKSTSIEDMKKERNNLQKWLEGIIH
jgi:hypothetical protein